MKIAIALAVLLALLVTVPVAFLDHEKHMRACTSASLRPLEEVWTLNDQDLIEKIDYETEDYRSDILAYFAVIFYNDTTLIFDDYESSVISPEVRSKVVMYILKRAAEQGSSVAKAEIGASLIFCYQNVDQDVISGLTWLLHPLIMLNRESWISALYAYDKIVTEFLASLVGLNETKVA